MYQIILSVVIALLICTPTTSHAVIKKGAQLPTFSATNVSGEKISSTLYTGKVQLFMVSTEYCTYCKTAIPYLNRLHDQYGTSGLHVQGLITGPGFGKEALKRYMDNNEVHYSMVVMDNKTMYETIGAHSVPTFLLISKKGTVAGYFRGYSDMNLKMIEQQTKTLLAE